MIHTSSLRVGVPSVAPALLIAIASLSTAAHALPVQQAREPDLARAAHLLGRLTFGPRPGEAQRVAAMGIDRWLDRQLHPGSIVDSAGVNALTGCALWNQPIEQVAAHTSSTARMMSDIVPGRVAGVVVRIASRRGLILLTRDSASRAGPFGQLALEDGQLLGCRLARVEASDQQLLEVMTDFWMNHFSIWGPRLPARGAVVEWDRVVIRPNALGRFRDLLGAVVRSPTMLEYLDNAVSAADSARQTLAEHRRGAAAGPRTAHGLNENYARELLELHTLGVDGGYTQDDVIGVARALTGWTHSAATARGALRLSLAADRRAEFVFDSATHDAEEKIILGRILPGGRGMEDAEDVLDLLARHPSTARFIARKLAVRLVSDDPPAALVNRAATTFRRTDGDIAAVVRSIVTSPEFTAPATIGSKFKSPLELVLSIRRALDAPIDTDAEIIDFLIDLDQPPFGKQTPEGWPETAAGWANAGAMRTRVLLAVRIADGDVPSIPINLWPEWNRLVDAPFDVQLDGVTRTLLHGRVSPATRAALASARPAPGSLQTRERTLRDLIALALSSPEFQTR